MRPAPRALGLAIVVAAVLFAVLMSLMLGSRLFSPATTLQALWQDNGDAHVIVVDQRLPRTVLGLVVGIALAASGALMQGQTRNPLADPGLFGVSAGATLGITVLVVLGGPRTMPALTLAAFAGAVAATVLVWVIGTAGGRGGSVLTILLVGVAVTAVVGGIVSLVQVLSPQLFMAVRAWGAGDLEGAEWSLVAWVSGVVLLGLALAAVAARGLNAEALGDDLATALGSNRALTRTVVVLSVTLLCGVGTAAMGPVLFIGMMVPHVARWIGGVDQRWILAYSCGLGPVLLIGADVVGRLILAPAEIPAGIVAAFVGAPVLIILVRRRQASGL